MTTYRSGDTSIEAYLAVPSGAGPWPGVVVIHDSLGFKGDVIAQADRLAGNGHLAIAPALYSRGNPAVCVVTTALDAMRGSGRTFDDIDAARRALLDGAKDRYLRGHAQRLDRALHLLTVEHDVKEYPEVGHGFLNDLPGVAVSRVSPVTHLLGLHHRDEESAADARRRIDAFFDEHLKRRPV